MERKIDFNILVVDDETQYREALSKILSNIGYKVYLASNGISALEILKKHAIDLILTDLRMPVMDGNTFIHEMKKNNIYKDVIVMTAYGSIESAVHTMREGILDYFVKSDDLEKIVEKIHTYAQKKKKSIEQNEIQPIIDGQKYFFSSKNKEYTQILKTCNRISKANINILLLGESGVGKEILASYIHKNGNRANKPFVAVNCQALPIGVIESELFGHEKGSFTGAIDTRIGKFEKANGGIIFLDEIGDLPIETQGKLLRVIENKKIERIGGNKEISLDVKFISATNKDLSKMVKDGKFREDLFYRINSLTIEIPPLRSRKSDLPEFIDFFIKKISQDYNKEIKNIQDEVYDFLIRYDYPGNIRELKNIIEVLIALNENDGILSMSEILQFRSDFINSNILETSNSDSLIFDSLKMARANFERKYIEDALNKNDGVVSKTAKDLCISARQLWNKINQYKIKIKE